MTNHTWFERNPYIWACRRCGLTIWNSNNPSVNSSENTYKPTNDPPRSIFEIANGDCDIELIKQVQND